MLAATCDDKKQNQGEDEIDCGGPCPACGELILRRDRHIEDAFSTKDSLKLTNLKLSW